MMPFYYACAASLEVAVLAVEYVGYGAYQEESTPSARSAFRSVEAAYQHALRLGHTPDQIILYGQSIGSAPVCAVAAANPVGGVVLHSPIATGLRTMTDNGPCSPVCMFACLEPFNNLRAIKRIESVVFIIHGTEDEEVPCSHGEMLHAAAQAPHPPYWVEGAGHSDIVENHSDEYFRQLRFFVDGRRDLEADDAAPQKISGGVR